MKELRSNIGSRTTPAIREAEGSPVIEGYAALFDVEADIGGWFMETIRQGAFSESLSSEERVLAFFNHDPNLIIGSTDSGTLSLRQDSTGLWNEITPPNTQSGRDVAENVRRGLVRGQSIMFSILEERWHFAESKGQPDRREIIRAKLYEAGPVVFPAYEDTSIGARSNQFAQQNHLEARSAWEAARKEAEKQDSPEVTFVGVDPVAVQKKLVALRAKFRHTFA
jgi:HK97 family phage prohead protease